MHLSSTLVNLKKSKDCSSGSAVVTIFFSSQNAEKWKKKNARVQDNSCRRHWKRKLNISKINRTGNNPKSDLKLSVKNWDMLGDKLTSRYKHACNMHFHLGNISFAASGPNFPPSFFESSQCPFSVQRKGTESEWIYDQFSNSFISLQHIWGFIFMHSSLSSSLLLSQTTFNKPQSHAHAHTYAVLWISWSFF